MKAKIRGVIDLGTHSSERVIIDIQEDTNLHFFMVMDTTYIGDTHISNKLRHTHWFVNQRS